MKIINSISGGRTSGYIAMNYPSDYNIFSIVCVDQKSCASKDAKLMQYANDKIEKYCSHYGEIIGTAEDPIIFKTMYDLEQMLGKEIIWLRGLSFDQLIKKSKALPARHARIGRFCTTWLKIAPFFEFWFKYTNDYEKWGVNVGFRYDEKERVNQFTTKWKYPYLCNNYGKHRQKWNEIEWRYGLFPLVNDKIVKPKIDQFWKGKNIQFAEDSNCQHCIFKSKEQIKMNYINNPDQIIWSKSMEDYINRKWHKDFSIEDAISSELDESYFYGGDAGCQAGECIN